MPSASSSLSAIVLALLFFSSFGSQGQTVNGWRTHVCEALAEAELGKRASAISDEQIQSMCGCMSTRWSDMVDAESLAEGEILVADACVADWPDGVVLSWKSSEKGMTLPLEPILEEQAWLDQLWLLGESVWLVKVTTAGEASSLPGNGGEPVEYLQVGDKAVAYLDQQVGEYWSITSLNSGKTAWVRQDRLSQLNQLEMVINLGFVEVGVTGSDMCEIAIKDSSRYDMMLDLRKGRSHSPFALEAQQVSVVELLPGNYQYLAWIPSNQDILPRFGVYSFEQGKAYEWVFFVTSH